MFIGVFQILIGTIRRDKPSPAGKVARNATDEEIIPCTARTVEAETP